MDTAFVEALIQDSLKFECLPDPVPGGSVALGVFHEVGIAEIQSVVLISPVSLLPSYHAEGAVIEPDYREIKPRRTAVSSSCEFIMNPPSPHTAMTFFSGNTIFAAIAAGSPAPIVASELSSKTVLGSYAL